MFRLGVQTGFPALDSVLRANFSVAVKHELRISLDNLYRVRKGLSRVGTEKVLSKLTR